MQRSSWGLAVAVAIIAAVGNSVTASGNSRTCQVAESVIDGDTFRLEDGQVVRLAGIAAAKSLTPAARASPPPIVAQARAALTGLVVGRSVCLEPSSLPRDRHGRIQAHVYLDPSPQASRRGRWVQEALLEQGVARVATTLDMRRYAAEMLSVEREARGAGLGIWGLRFYRVLATGETSDHVGSFQIVEGVVLDVARVRSRVFLNFGDDWRTDFTIALDARARKRFRDAGVELEYLAGAHVRVRGWIRSYNGPMIEVTHPEQIEMLDG